MVDSKPHTIRTAPDGSVDGTKSPTILIVDDEPDILFTLSNIMEIGGYPTLTAGTGSEALQVLRGHPVDIALLDIRLPDMSGTELLQAIKAASPETDCIMSTGDPSFETVLDALNAGASAYFEKPVQPPALLNAIQGLSEKQRLREDNKRLMKENEKTIEHLRLLQELSRTISSSLEMDDVLIKVRNAIIEYMGYDRCSIYLVDPELEVIQGRWGTDREGNQKDLSSFVIPLSTNRPMARVARGEMEYFLTENMESFIHSDGPQLAEEMKGVRAHAVLPLEAKGKIVGVLTVDNLMSGKPITKEDVDQLLPFSYQAAIAIDNARIYKKARDLSQQEAEKVADLSMLWQVAQALSYELNLEKVFDTVRDGVCSAMHVNHFSLFLHNKTFDDYDLRSGCGVDQELARKALFEGENPIGLKVIAEGDLIYDRIGAAPDTPLGQLANQAGLHSMMCVPLRVGEEPIGVMAVYSVRENRFGARDERFLSTLASMSASAIRNAQSYGKQRSIADALQHELLSEPPEKIGPYVIESKYQPALDEARVGGDFYDVIELPDGRAAILLADVSGKGLKAAVYTAMGKYMFRGLLMDDPSPGVLLGKLNSALYRYTEAGMFITLFYGLLDPETGRLTYANAGHESPLHYMAEHDFSIALDTTGVVLGVDPDAVYVERQVHLKDRDVLFLYTDGLTDARCGDSMLGIEGLQELLNETLRENAPSIVDPIYQAALDYAEGFLHDDIALIAIRAGG